MSERHPALLTREEIDNTGWQALSMGITDDDEYQYYKADAAARKVVEWILERGVYSGYEAGETWIGSADWQALKDAVGVKP